MIMKLHRPKSRVVNGCGLLAVAALTGGEDIEYKKRLQPQGGRFSGTTTDEEQTLLLEAGIETRSEYAKRKRMRLDRYLPTEGCGIVEVRRANRYHALAFYGKMVYDPSTRGRWQWVYDNYWASASICVIIFVNEVTS